MTSFVPSNAGEPPARPPSRLAEICVEIDRARPGVSPESDEYRTAVLLLMVGETGLNVDRLAMRARYPREFVSRCLRRLSDNGLWVDGGLRCTWGLERARSEQFWWDVDVALGRQLRRVDPAGQTEWGPVDGWFKDFEYTSRNADEKAVYNEYRHIPVHDPEPDAPAAPLEDVDQRPTPAESHDRIPAAPPEPAAAPPPAPILPDWPGGAHWLAVPVVDVTVPADTPLGKGWTKADWLT